MNRWPSIGIYRHIGVEYKEYMYYVVSTRGTSHVDRSFCLIYSSSSCWCLNPFGFPFRPAAEASAPHLTIADDIAERFINSIGGSIRAFLWSIHRTCRHQKFKEFYLFSFGFFKSFLFWMLICRHAIKRCHDDIYLLLMSRQRTFFFSPLQFPLANSKLRHVHIFIFT